MNAQTWLFIAILCFSVSFVLLVAAVFMFIKMRIPSVIDDLSGKKVAREIREMREKNEADKNKTETEKKPSRTAYSHPSKQLSANSSGEPGKSGEKKFKREEPEEGGFKTTVLFKAEDDEGITAVLSENESGATAVLSEDEAGATAVLSEDEAGATAVLSEDEAGATAVLSEDEAGATAVLSEDEAGATAVLSENEAGATAVLSENEVGGTAVLSADENGDSHNSGSTAGLSEEGGKPVPFKVTRSIVEIHTDERIG